MKSHFGVWKTTVLGGVIFLLPFAIVVFVLGQIAKVIYSLTEHLESAVPQWSIGGVSVAMLLVIAVLLAVCYAAGLAARRSFGKQFSEKIERTILMLFPRYAIWKQQLASKVDEQDGDLFHFQPVLVAFDELTRVGFEIERTSGPLQGTSQRADAKATAPHETPAEADDTVTVYLPGSPDPWNGHVVHVSARRVKPLPMKFNEAAALCEAMGRGAGAILK